MHGFMNKYQNQYKKEKKKVNFKDKDTILALLMCLISFIPLILGFMPAFSINGESFNLYNYAFGYSNDGHWDLTFNMFGFTLIIVPVIYALFMLFKVLRAKHLKNPGTFLIISYIMFAACGFFAVLLSYVGLNTIPFDTAFNEGNITIEYGAIIAAVLLLIVSLINVSRIIIKRIELKKNHNNLI